MNVQSLSFLAFLAATVSVCVWTARRWRPGAEWLLLAACGGFLCAGGVAGAAWLALSAVLVWGAAGQIVPGRRRRKLVFSGMLCLLVGQLLVFKYSGFLSGGRFSPGWAPLGLSFFTFQQIWYLKEAYQGRAQPVGLRRYGLYALFFPTLTSGPILRPGAFFPQLQDSGFLHPDGRDAAAGLYALCCGMAKKVLLADPLGIVVNNGWARLTELSAPAAWLVILGYTLQLYFDFSGYCDIAAGAARLLGIRLPVNFDSPYRSLSVGEFWKRWHITLTTFLRECLYFPLGGSRRGPARTSLNILLIFLVSGFWHGAGWTFLVWGALHGLAQVAERAWGPRRDRLPKAVQWALTFLFVNGAWVFFRAPSLSDALALLHTAVCGVWAPPGDWLLAGLFTTETGAVELLAPALTPWMVLARWLVLYGAGMTVALWPRNAIAQMDTFRPTAWRAALLAAAMAWAVLSFTGVTTFIYSNF